MKNLRFVLIVQLDLQIVVLSRGNTLPRKCFTNRFCCKRLLCALATFTLLAVTIHVAQVASPAIWQLLSDASCLVNFVRAWLYLYKWFYESSAHR